MTRIVFLALITLMLPLPVLAAEAPAGQVPIGSDQVLRGHFSQSLHAGPGQPMESTGHFLIAPARGLIWGMEKPMQTTTIITPQGSVQDFGGLTLKLHIKNLQHLYEMVGGALAGNWSGLEQDYILTPGSQAGHWQMLLTPKPGKPGLPYTSITVSGTHYVENITMKNTDGTIDTLSFSDTILGHAPLAADESAAFAKAGK